jgi:XrtJ-associated TM-motif-TM protein
MIKFSYVVLSMLFMATTLHAQGGCVDSPEAPTALLLVVGSAGMLYGPRLLKKVFRHGDSR